MASTIISSLAPLIYVIAVIWCSAKCIKSSTVEQSPDLLSVENESLNRNSAE